MVCEQKSLTLAHLLALSEELRYRIGEAKRALERIDDVGQRLTIILRQNQEPPF